MTKLEELKAAYVAATPGEWRAQGFNSQGGKVACLLGPDELRLVSGNFKRDDAKFIVLARNLMPQLLAVVSGIRKVLDEDFLSHQDRHERIYDLMEELK